ncbi:MAG TPA: DUF445 domain-containing protein [Acidimicrobiales bacterium]|jgi:uncharacterized membrane-anchored protein YjiN (DUF445 family)|nr:DUF445 domain-containing protein [Acidimicrobiales bacterium]
MADATLPRLKSEEIRRQRLVVTRRFAGALLAAATAVFILVTLIGASGWLGYVQATAEASMVGGLADWFAVTALFRHPLGIPVPHTAIIPERKDQFGETLGDFIQDSFLTPDTIVARVRGARVSDRLATWLSDRANAERLAGHIADGAVAIADLVKDEDVHATLEAIAREQLDRVALAPMAGRALRAVTAENRHEDLIDSALRGLFHALEEHADDLRRRFEEKSPWWLPGAVEDRIFDRLLLGAQTVLRDMTDNHEHGLRVELDARIEKLINDLETSPELRARGEQLKHDLLNQQQLREWVAGAWTELKAQLRASAADPQSELRSRLTDAIVAGGTRLRDDPALKSMVDEGAETAVRYVVERFDGEIAALVTSTIARWDGEETARRLELLLGADLQFIRINGTVVGGVAGLVLHSIAQALS